MLLVVGNFLSAHFIAKVHGYADVPVGELTLLLCTRPSLFMLLCGLGFFLVLFEDEGFYDVRRFPSTIGRRRSNKIRQYLANVCCANAVTAGIIQTLSAAYFFRTVRTGTSRKFYYSGHLNPYWRGVPAQMMYAGALLWTIFYFFTIFFLILFGYGMLEKIFYEAGERNRDRKLFRLFFNPLFRRINNLSLRKHAMLNSKEDLNFGGRIKLNLISVLVAAKPLYLRLFALLYERPREEQPLGTMTEEQMAAYDDALRAHEENLQQLGLENLHLEASERALHGRRGINLDEILLIVLIFSVFSVWVPTYIAQWLFWAGFVDSMGTE